LGTIVAADELYRFFHAGDTETKALRGVSLAVESGELVALVGPSGSGKSTLLACLAGLDVPDGGQVILLGEKISRLPEHLRDACRRSRIGFLLQSGNLDPGLTLSENVWLPLLLAGRRDAARPAALLASLGLAGRGAALPRQLSGGELARAGLAVALALDPPLLLADEPTAEVDAATEREVFGLIAARCADGAAAVIATHSQVLAAAASRIIRLQDGRVVDEPGSR
jgi:putative ABC transport system ATP-binding protein